MPPTTTKTKNTTVASHTSYNTCTDDMMPEKEAPIPPAAWAVSEFALAAPLPAPVPPVSTLLEADSMAASSALVAEPSEVFNSPKADFEDSTVPAAVWTSPSACATMLAIGLFAVGSETAAAAGRASVAADSVAAAAASAAGATLLSAEGAQHKENKQERVCDMLTLKSNLCSVPFSVRSAHGRVRFPPARLPSQNSAQCA